MPEEDSPPVPVRVTVDELRTKQTGWVERWGPVLTSIVGSIVVAVVAVVSIRANSATTKNTNESFDKRTQRDFLHAQRISAFSTFLGIADDLQADEVEVRTYRTARPNLPIRGGVPADIVETVKGFGAKVASLRRASGQISLVGQSGVVRAAAAVIRDHEGATASLVDFYDYCPGQGLAGNCPEKAQAQYDNVAKILDTDITRYEDESRREIGAVS